MSAENEIPEWQVNFINHWKKDSLLFSLLEVTGIEAKEPFPGVNLGMCSFVLLGFGILITHATESS